MTTNCYSKLNYNPGSPPGRVGVAASSLSCIIITNYEQPSGNYYPPGELLFYYHRNKDKEGPNATPWATSNTRTGFAVNGPTDIGGKNEFIFKSLIIFN